MRWPGCRPPNSTSSPSAPRPARRSAPRRTPRRSSATRVSRRWRRNNWHCPTTLWRIVADPEWRFEPWSRDTGLDRAADNDYPTTCTEVIAARDVHRSRRRIACCSCGRRPDVAARATVMEAWGFDYESHYIWDKNRIGTGYWNREKHELLLIGTRGNIPCPAPGTQWDLVIMTQRGKHTTSRMLPGHDRALFSNPAEIELNSPRPRTARLGRMGQ